MTVWVLYYMDMKDQVSKENPGKGVPEIVKIIAGMYGSLDPHEKAKYFKRAKKAREQFLLEMEEFK
mgnify:CR=1 FL=1